MSRVIKLRTAIVAALTAVHPRVYYERAVPGAVFPYLVYDLPNSVDQGGTETFVLDVDGWDKPAVQGASGALEVLMGRVDAALDRRVVYQSPDGGFLSPFQYVEPDPADGVSLVIYRDRRLAISDDNPELLRRTYVYNIKLFQKRRAYHGWN